MKRKSDDSVSDFVGSQGELSPHAKMSLLNFKRRIYTRSEDKWNARDRLDDSVESGLVANRKLFPAFKFHHSGKKAISSSQSRYLLNQSGFELQENPQLKQFPWSPVFKLGKKMPLPLHPNHKKKGRPSTPLIVPLLKYSYPYLSLF